MGCGVIKEGMASRRDVQQTLEGGNWERGEEDAQS